MAKAPKKKIDYLPWDVFVITLVEIGGLVCWIIFGHRAVRYAEEMARDLSATNVATLNAILQIIVATSTFISIMAVIIVAMALSRAWIKATQDETGTLSSSMRVYIGANAIITIIKLMLTLWLIVCVAAFGIFAAVMDTTISNLNAEIGTLQVFTPGYNDSFIYIYEVGLSLNVTKDTNYFEDALHIITEAWALEGSCPPNCVNMQIFSLILPEDSGCNCNTTAFTAALDDASMAFTAAEISLAMLLILCLVSVLHLVALAMRLSTCWCEKSLMGVSSVAQGKVQLNTEFQLKSSSLNLK